MFVLIWTGLGFVTAIIAVIGYALSTDDNYFIGWPLAAALNLAFYFILGRYTREATYVDPSGRTVTGEATYAELSSLFMISVRNWTIVFLVFPFILWFMSATQFCIMDGAFFSKMVTCDRPSKPWF